MKSTNGVWCIILTYYPKRSNIFSLTRAFGAIPTIVVDNTPGGSVLDISHAHLIETKKNLGYTGGVNKGLRFALGRGASWCIVCNDDLRLTRSGVTRFVQALSASPPCIAGPFAGVLDRHRWTTIFSSREGTGRFDYISGSFFAIHKEVIDRVGLFFDPYFIYYEDVELCIRATMSGYPLRRVHLTAAAHNDSTSYGKGSLRHQYYLARNHLLFVERNAPIGVKVRESLRLPKTLWEHWKKREWGALAGVKDYCFRRFGVDNRL